MQQLTLVEEALLIERGLKNLFDGTSVRVTTKYRPDLTPHILVEDANVHLFCLNVWGDAAAQYIGDNVRRGIYTGYLAYLRSKNFVPDEQYQLVTDKMGTCGVEGLFSTEVKFPLWKCIIDKYLDPISDTETVWVSSMEKYEITRVACNDTIEGLNSIAYRDLVYSSEKRQQGYIIISGTDSSGATISQLAVCYTEKDIVMLGRSYILDTVSIQTFKNWSADRRAIWISDAIITLVGSAYE